MIRRRIQAICVLAVSGLVAGLVWIAPVSAVNATFGQKILPLDCVFTTINAGTGQLYYVTPQACGIFVPPPNANNYYTVPQAGGTYAAYSPDRTIFYVPDTAASKNAGLNLANGNYPQWQPIVSPSTEPAKAATTRAKVSGTSVAVAIGGIVGLIALIVFIF
jgi:hypothetical protein